MAEFNWAIVCVEKKHFNLIGTADINMESCNNTHNIDEKSKRILSPECSFKLKWQVILIRNLKFCR